ncbi:MAG: hypothetical protein WCL20_05325 [Actinomycetes bacterium]
MGRRSRRRQGGGVDAAPTSVYQLPGGDELTLRGVMSASTREEYRRAASGESASAAAAREDAWHRAVEFLFERLATGWTVAGVEYSEQRELLLRFRAASSDERNAVRVALREHLHETFPELEAP